MRQFSFSTLRARLMLLVLLALIPALGLILYTAAAQRTWAAREAQENALRLARSFSSNQDDLIEGARQILIALAQMPMVRDGNTAECNAVFADLLKQYPRYNNFVATKPNGDVFCSAVPTTPQINLADRSHFQTAVRTGDFAIADYLVARTTGKPILGFAYPVLVASGQIRAVVFAGLDLGWLNALVAKTELPAGATLTVIDRKGTILARFPNPEKWVGKSMPSTPLVQTILSQAKGTAEASGMDGIPRLYGFSPLGHARGAYVSIGIPKDVAFAAANRILVRNLIAFGIVAVLAFIAAWFGADLFVLRRVNDLVSATQRISAGDLSARTGLPYGAGELSELARAFDQMAGSTERLITERKQADEETRRHLQRLTILREINLATNSTLDLHGVLNVLMEKIDLLLPYTAVLLWLFNWKTGQLERAACWNLDEREWKGRKLTGTPSLVQAAIEGKTPVVARNVQTDARTLDPTFYRKHGLISYLGVPLLVNGEVLGVVVFLTREEHKFSDEEVEFLSTLAGQAAIAIHNSQLYQQTKKQAVELEKANKMQADFAAVIAHDLRSPLTNTLSTVTMMQDGLFGSINEEQRKWLGKIEVNTQKLVDLVNNFLDLSKLETGCIDLVMEEVDLEQLIQNSLDDCQVLAHDKNVLLRSGVDSGLPRLKADPRRLGQVFANLLSNAIKFTAERGTIEMGAAQSNGAEVRVWVKDNGAGMSPQEISTLFQKYRQTRSGKDSKHKGTGLGLVICKMIVEAHGGKIWVESDEGKGTTVTFMLPYEG